MSEIKKNSNGNRPKAFGGPGGGPAGTLGRPVEKAKNFNAALKRLMGYIRRERSAFIIVIALAVLSTAFSIVSPKLLGNTTTLIFKGVTGSGIDFQAVLKILILLGILYLFSSLFGFIQQYVMSGTAQKIVYILRKDVDEKLSRLPLSYTDGRTHGEIMSRVTNDIDNIGSTLQQNLTQLITSVCTLLGVVIMMLTISPLLTLVTLVTIPLSILLTGAVTRRSRGQFVEQQKAIGELNGHVEELFTGHKIVKAFGYEQKSVEEFDAINERLYNAGWKANFISGLIMPLMGLVNNIGYIMVCVVGGLLVARRSLQVGDIQAFLQYSRQFAMPITQTANIANIIQSTLASAERVFEVLDEAEESPNPPLQVRAKQIAGEIRFEEVCFRYREDTPLIEDLSVLVKPGQTAAIVGPTGAGKTTLVNLLMRFYDCRSGKILMDGKDIRDMHRQDLRANFGMVLQDTWLFNGSIRDNIAYGKENAAEEEIIHAAKMAHADHFIRTLPEGYDTILAEEASNLSQGQKQLLTIARAFLADPAILILDEATSSVDTRTELTIQKAMQNLMKDRTSFVIAHRLSTIRDADLIMVMNHGRVIELGSHPELMERNGFYTELYNSQFKGVEL